MLTNVFRIGGLQQVSWFQLLPEGELIFPNVNRKERSWQDPVAKQVMRAHMWLQEEGNFSTWTLSEDRVKLWLFLPGRHDSPGPSVETAITGLKVVGVGLWRAPGDCNEVSLAFSQALQNRIERGFRNMSYVRFGDVFVRCHKQGVSEPSIRKPLPSCELVFAASEDAIFVHVLVRRKRVRHVVNKDLQAALVQQRSSVGQCDNNLAVVVAPNGLTGRLSGCCPNDLVTQLYRSKLQAFNAQSLPFRVVASSSTNGSLPMAQPCFAEVSLGQQPGCTGSMRQGVTRGEQVGTPSDGSEEAQVLIYPLEAVLVPMGPAVPAYSFLRRCWLQEWAGTKWLEEGVEEEGDMPVSRYGLYDGSSKERSSVTWLDANGSGPRSGGGISSSTSGESSSSSSSSQGSSGSSSSSEGDGEGSSFTGVGELEADAESLGSKAAGMTSSRRSNSRMPANTSHLSDSEVADVKLSQGTKRGRTKPVVGVVTGDPPTKALKRSSSIGADMSALLDGTVNEKKGGGFPGDPSAFGGGLSLSIGGGTPKGGGSQLGTPWDQWGDDGGSMGLGMGMGMDMQSDADILAEFGDFGDFFEDDALGFGEPPGTAESQALMFSLPEYAEVTNTPGTAPLDASDPMLLPILDFPMLEFNQHQGIEPLSARGTKPSIFKENNQALVGARSSPPMSAPAMAFDSRSKAEAMLLFAPGFEPVDLAGAQDVCASSTFSRSPYIPEYKRSGWKSPSTEKYVYGAAAPPTPRLETLDTPKVEQGSDNTGNASGESIKKKEAGGDYIVVSSAHGVKEAYVNGLNGQQIGMEERGTEVTAAKSGVYNKRASDGTGGSGGAQPRGGPLPALSPSSVRKRESRDQVSARAPVAMLATDLECALLQVLMCRSQDSSSSVSSNGFRSGIASPGNGTARAASVPPKESSSDITQVQSDVNTQGRVPPRPQQDRRKKVPERIAGHAEDDMHDGGTRAAQVGVWRPVGAPKLLQQPKSTAANNNAAVDSRLGSNNTSPLDPIVEDGLPGVAARQSQWLEVLDAIPLLAQQAAIAVDVSLDGQNGDGPFGWLAAQELRKQQRLCGPGWSHVNCGGKLSVGHCLDHSGLEILNPLSAEISAATVATLLQSDVRAVMSNAFGEASTDGPLGVGDWCRGRVLSSDGGNFGESVNTDSKEVNSTITIVGDPFTPPQSGGVLKGADTDLDLRRSSSSSRAFDSSSLSEQIDASQRRSLGDDMGMSYSEVLGTQEPTILAIPTPALLVGFLRFCMVEDYLTLLPRAGKNVNFGYQDDWLKTSSSTLQMWEKAPLEPYAPSKQVNYHVVCLASEPLVTAAADFFHQLSSVYEVCRLGSHMPAGMPVSQVGSVASSRKQNPPGFMLVDVPGITSLPNREDISGAPSYSLAKAFVASMTGNWNMAEYRRALRKVCKALPISAGSSTSLRDPEQGPCTVVYVVCPVSDPAGVLQTMVDACSSLGSVITGADREHRLPISIGGDDLVSGILGFSVPRFALQLVTAETIFNPSGSPRTRYLDVLKEIALGVYNKARRIPRCAQMAEFPQQSQGGALGARTRVGNSGAPLQSTASLPGLWKDCSTGRSSGSALTRDDTMGTLDSTISRNTWESGWKTQTDAGTSSVDAAHEAVRYVYEPAFILAEAGTPDVGVGLAPARTAGRDAIRAQGDEASASTHCASGVARSGSDLGMNALGETSDGETSASGQQCADLHCCYSWTEDGHWMVSVWTDGRGELLDTLVLPLAGIDAQRDGGLQGLFGQVLQQGLQLLAMAVDAGSRKPRAIIITRLGGFYEKESQEWHRVILSVGCDDVRKWPVQIRHSPNDLSGSAGTGSTCDMGLMSDRALGLSSSGPTSPSPSSSSFGGRGKTTAYSKSGADLSSSQARRQGQVMSQIAAPEPAKGPFQWVHSISLVSVRVDHNLQIVTTSDGAPQGASSSAPSGGVTSVGVSPVRTLSSTGASYLLVPSYGFRPLAPSSLQLLPCSSSLELPPLTQCLQSSGPACPVASAFVISGSTTLMTSDSVQKDIQEDWPSTVNFGLVAHYSGSSRLGNLPQEVGLGGLALGNSKTFKSPVVELKDQALEGHKVLQVVASEMHALSWLTVGLTCIHRRSPLPFHCEVAQRLQRLLVFLDAEFGPSQPHLQS